MQHPQHNLNQNIGHNWAISPNLGRKTKFYPFWLKIGTHDIVEVLIANPELDFWNSDPNNNFWAHLGPKTQSYSFCLKIGVHNISRMLIPNPDLDFWNFNANIQFWANLDPNIQSCSFCLKIGTHSISKMLISKPDLDFWNFDKFGPKKPKLSVLSENWYTWYLKEANSYCNISFLNFKS